ncbi:MAG: hypothetical protein ACYCOU_08160, partial [Sulfobacillus sp.]
AGKSVVLLEPDRGYYGISQMFAAGRIFQSVAMSSKDKNSFAQLVQLCRRFSKDKKYLIARFANQAQADFFAEQVSPSPMINHSYDDPDLDAIATIVRQEPKEFTVLAIYDRLRAGIQLDTKNICAVYDTAGANTDTTAQGLLGRCCGYHKESHGVEVYCNKKAATRYLRWVESSFNRESIPGKSKNIVQGAEPAVGRWRTTVPVLLDLPTESVAAIRREVPEGMPPNKRRYRQCPSEVVRALRKKFPQVEELGWQESRRGNMIVFDELNSEKSFKDWWIKNLTGSLKGKPTSGFDHSRLAPGKYFYLIVNLKRCDDYCGKVLVTAKEHFCLETPAVTSGKEQFHPDHNLTVQLNWQNEL